MNKEKFHIRQLVPFFYAASMLKNVEDQKEEALKQNQTSDKTENSFMETLSTEIDYTKLKHLKYLESKTINNFFINLVEELKKQPEYEDFLTSYSTKIDISKESKPDIALYKTINFLKGMEKINISFLIKYFGLKTDLTT